MADSTRNRTAFITGSSMDEEIKDLLLTAKKIRVAVPYWGAGATKRLGLGSLASRDVIVVCDLKSGACNPNEIICLQNKLGKKKVRNRDHLRAKVWLTEKDAIIGSSNASANGLGLEGDELQGPNSRTTLLCKRARTFEGLPLGAPRAWEQAATAVACTRRSNDMRWKMEDFARFLTKPP